jgi:hypothetical protein
MKFQIRIIALAAIAMFAFSAFAQSAKKPSGAVRAKSTAAPVVQTQPPASPKVDIPPPDISERAATADEVRQDEHPVAPGVKAEAPVEAPAVEAPTLATPETEAPALAMPTENALPAPATQPAAISPAASSDMEAPALATRPKDSNVLLPIGTAIRMKLDSAISTSDSRPGDSFSGKVSEDVVVEGKTVIPKGATLSGRITRLFEPRRIAGRPAIQLVPDTVKLPNGKTLTIAAVIVDTGDPDKLHVNEEGRIKGPGMSQMDKVEFVAGTSAGTVAGTVINPGFGTLVGAASGATLTTAHWLWRRHSLELPAGTELIMEISSPVAADTTTLPRVAQGGN